MYIANFSDSSSCFFSYVLVHKSLCCLVLAAPCFQVSQNSRTEHIHAQNHISQMLLNLHLEVLKKGFNLCKVSLAKGLLSPCHSSKLTQG